MITVPGRLRDPGCPSRSRPVLYRPIDLMAPEPCDNKASDLYGPRSSLRFATKADASWREASSSPICAARTSGGISSRSASIYSAARAMRQAPTARAEPLREWAAWHQPCRDVAATELLQIRHRLCAKQLKDLALQRRIPKRVARQMGHIDRRLRLFTVDRRSYRTDLLRMLTSHSGAPLRCSARNPVLQPDLAPDSTAKPTSEMQICCIRATAVSLAQLRIDPPKDRQALNYRRFAALAYGIFFLYNGLLAVNPSNRFSFVYR